MVEAHRLYRTVGLAIGEYRVLGAPIDDGLLELGEQQRAHQRWIEGSNEEAVVAPRRQARDGPARMAANAMGDQPLAPLGGRQSATDVVTETFRSHQWCYYGVIRQAHDLLFPRRLLPWSATMCVGTWSNPSVHR